MECAEMEVRNESVNLPIHSSLTLPLGLSNWCWCERLSKKIHRGAQSDAKSKNNPGQLEKETDQFPRWILVCSGTLVQVFKTLVFPSWLGRIDWNSWIDSESIWFNFWVKDCKRSGEDFRCFICALKTEGSYLWLMTMILISMDDL